MLVESKYNPLTPSHAHMHTCTCSRHPLASEPYTKRAVVQKTYKNQQDKNHVNPYVAWIWKNWTRQTHCKSLGSLSLKKQHLSLKVGAWASQEKGYLSDFKLFEQGNDNRALSDMSPVRAL